MSPSVPPAERSPPTASSPRRRPAPLEPSPSLHSHWKQMNWFKWFFTGFMLQTDRNQTNTSKRQSASAPSLPPEVAAGLGLQPRGQSAVQRGLAALHRRLHQEQRRHAQQRPQQGEPAVHMTTQLRVDHARVETEGGDAGA